MTSTPSSSDDRRFGLVVFGATSFVGQIVCRYLVARLGVDGPITWAIAGRNAEKLEAVAVDTGAKVEKIVADATSPTDMESLAKATKVVMSTVGPYALFGSELVAAVAEAGTDYCDLSGEPHWMQKMIDTNSEAARASGARIVHSCGFDSIPSDLGVWFTQQQAVERFGQPCDQISMRVKAMKGSASGGTIASMMNILAESADDPSLRKILTNPYALAPEGMRSGVRQPNVTMPTHDEVSGAWVAPFVMASVNTRIVLRTHALLGQPWGEGFLYDEAVITGEGPFGAAKAAGMTGALGAFMGLAHVGPTRNLLNKYVLPEPGEGPSPQKQEAGYFALRFFGTTAAGDTITTSVTGDRDPGYGSTAKMISEAALCLLDRTRSDVTGGFWTPATAMGVELIEQLEARAGLRFAQR